MTVVRRIAIVCVALSGTVASSAEVPKLRLTNGSRASDAARAGSDVRSFFTTYCFECHSDSSTEGGLDLSQLMETKGFDGSHLFEKLINSKMPPGDSEQPTAAEKRRILLWLAGRQREGARNAYRRLSRHEFVHAVNDLLGTELEIAATIPEDRGTRAFDSDRRIMLTKEMLSAYFSAADEMLEFALPNDGFLQERIWTTNKIRDSHQTYNIYVRDYKEGLLFSWTRANNGNNYSFFYDGFQPPEKGWYELTFDAAKLGDFEEDVSVLVYAGKYYFADDRPQPQRLLGVISLGDRSVKSYKVRGFLHPGENVSVHCYSKHTWRQKAGNQGAYITQLRVQGPVTEKWPPVSYQNVFRGLQLEVPVREANEVISGRSTLEQIGGQIAVSSFQEGMEKEKMLDGSNRTFWHSRFTPDVAKPPHYVILENPSAEEIIGLSYSTWSGGNGNGQVTKFEIYGADEGEDWGSPIVKGNLEIRLAAEQRIMFPVGIRKRFIKLLVTDAVSLDGKSLASIGKLDVVLDRVIEAPTTQRITISVASTSEEDLKRVIKMFAEKAFSTTLSDVELAPYYLASLEAFRRHGDFVRATKQGLKAVICSHRFLLAPGEHRNESYRIAADLARSIWLSVPDERLLGLAKVDSLSSKVVALEIDRMLSSPRARRMVHSFCNQWLDLRSFNKVSPSLKLYPTYNDLLNHFLPLETEAYLSYLIQENLPMKLLIDSHFSILNQRLAQHYGIEGVIGQALRKVSLNAESRRGGLLTMGSVLKVTTDGFDTSPILRGAWISKNIAGNTLRPPPESVESIEPSTNRATTLKEQIEEHKNNATCYACHKNIDPYGFALESFDATGRRRTNYRVAKPHAGTFQYRRQGYFDAAGKVDSSGQIGEAEFRDVRELKQILLTSHKQVAYNFAKKFFEYANGCEPTLGQRGDLYEMIPDHTEDCRMKDLITSVLAYSFTGDHR